MYLTLMQILAWLPVAMISSWSWPMSGIAKAASQASVMMFVAPGALHLIG